MNVTGIPYWWINNSSGEKVQGTTSSGKTINGSYSFYIPTTTMDVNVVYNIDLVGRTTANIGTLTVGGNQIFSAQSSYGKTTNYASTTILSLSTQSIDFSYTDKSSSWVVSTGYSKIYEVSIKY